MNKPILLGIGGAVVGVVVAFAAFTFLMGGETPVAAAAPPTQPVNVSGKLGPHLTLADRVFNLLPEPGSDRQYLKLQTVIEFESYDERWESVLHGCGHTNVGRTAPAETPATTEGETTPEATEESHGALLGGWGDLVVSAAPGGAPAPVLDRSSGGEVIDPCEAERQALMTEFEHEIGTGLQLIEDAVTTVVTAHTASEVATAEGKEALKAEIQAAVDALIHEPEVHRVLFLNFITQ